MTRRKFSITLITLFFGLALLAQPAFAAECFGMMGCIPGHSTGHLPHTEDNPPCNCTPSAQVLIRYARMPQIRSQIAPDMRISFHIDDAIPSQYDMQWLSQEWRRTADISFAMAAPSAHTPIFILNQSLLC